MDQLRRWGRRLLRLVVLVPAVPVVLGVMLTSPRAVSARGAGVFRPVNPSPSPVTKGQSIPPGPGALVALVLQGSEMRTAPAGRPLARLATHTEYGSPEALLVVAQSSGWLGVLSPQAGNGHVGWIPQGGASLSRVTLELRISLSARALSVLDGARVLARYTVAVGRPAAPTPVGRFAVTDRLNTGDPSGPYGCCILALSARAPHAIADWNGGDRIAIHSTTESSSIGRSVTHGCVRVTLDQGRWLLAHVPLGTPTVISA